MTSEEKEMFDFAILQRCANNGSHEDLFEIFGEQTPFVEPAKMSRFDPETKSYLLQEILTTSIPLIKEIERLTALGISGIKIEEESKKIEIKTDEISEFAKMQAEINRVD